MKSELVRLSKRLSHLLRHAPESYGVTLSPEGWAAVDAVLEGLTRSGADADLGTLAAIVAGGDKRRFELDLEAGRIRALHGHSVAVELDLPREDPPDRLYHGTVERFLAAIRAEGLRPRGRRAVHLSDAPEQAREVGGRRGAPVVLVVESGRMAAAGHLFRRSASGVWLTAEVPPEFLLFP